jgi:hypothetical protein
MAFQIDVWQVEGNTLSTIDKAKLDAESRLEEWLANDIRLIGLEMLVIGRQVSTSNGGRIDLLAVNRHADLIVIELKRDRTPREVIAQILDYASWVRHLDYEEISAIASAYLKKSLADAFGDFFNESLPENVNTAHSMVIVASEFDESSERIVQYLADEYKVGINVVFFTYFKQDGNELLGRAWLSDPEQVQEKATTKKRSPWSGYWFVNVGEGLHRHWEDNVKYGYIGAGQGEWYSKALKRLKVGDRIFAYQKNFGYLGYGVVSKVAVMIKDFIVESESKPLLDLELKAPRIAENKDDPGLSEWVVGVTWKKVFPMEEAKRFKGIFANQNIVCELRDPNTVSFLEQQFVV